MDQRLSDDLADLPVLLHEARERAARFLAGVGERPVGPPPAPREPVPLPERGQGTRGALEAFERRWEPGLSASPGPRYLGFVTGGSTPAALAGDWLTSAYDQNAASGGDSSAADLERETVTWLRDLLGLPAEQGLAALGPVRVLSGTPHSSVGKALSVLGLGRSALRRVGALPGREAVDVERLEAALRELDGEPAIVVANAGTVNTADFDDLRAVAALRERYPFWLHVDAAFGAFAALSPEHAHLVDGLGAADSICLDLHKWLNVPYDSAVQFTRRRDLQARVFRNSAAYLGPLGDRPDYLHLTPENSRRLRALPAWFTLAAYGREGHAEIVRRDIALAARLGERLAAMPAYRLLAPVRLNVVCFTLASAPEHIAEVARAVAETGEALLTTTEYAGVPALRAAFSNWRTTEADVDRVAKALERAAG
ncbi:pyridoxal phosphate-dependent decarboxylase family protein [Nonomuraea fastidiosa]|uniref:pyridoxal phosphate-dependent decarboxylase family protein n=1 Tax=Nonomuraea fastidiosa TaxID=46173 RepID=UPI00366D6F64